MADLGLRGALRRPRGGWSLRTGIILVILVPLMGLAVFGSILSAPRAENLSEARRAEDRIAVATLLADVQFESLASAALAGAVGSRDLPEAFSVLLSARYEESQASLAAALDALDQRPLTLRGLGLADEYELVVARIEAQRGLERRALEASFRDRAEHRRAERALVDQGGRVSGTVSQMLNGMTVDARSADGSILRDLALLSAIPFERLAILFPSYATGTMSAEDGVRLLELGGAQRTLGDELVDELPPRSPPTTERSSPVRTSRSSSRRRTGRPGAGAPGCRWTPSRPWSLVARVSRPSRGSVASGTFARTSPPVWRSPRRRRSPGLSVSL